MPQGLTVKEKIDTDGKIFLDKATATNEIKFRQDANLSAINLPDFGIDMDLHPRYGAILTKINKVSDRRYLH